MESCIHLIGEVTSECKLSHKRHGIDFYLIEVSCSRASGTRDHLPVILNYYCDYEIGQMVEIFGSVRTANVMEGDKKRLKVFIFANDVGLTADSYRNRVDVTGTICKRNPIRQTPHGKQITDAIIAVDRDYRKADYIPCVFWGADAIKVDQMEIGTQVTFTGRLQSRVYEKNCVRNEICEVSADHML